MQRILGFSVVVAAIDVGIITAVATLFAFLYNLSSSWAALEVTLAEDRAPSHSWFAPRARRAIEFLLGEGL